MKSLVSFAPLLLLAACHTPPSTPLPLPAKSAPEPRAIAATPPVPMLPAPASDQKWQEQAQLIDALLSQNDALTTQLATLTSAHASAAPADSVAVAPTVPAEAQPVAAVTTPPPPMPFPDPAMLVPNVDGVIDVAAVALAQNTDEPANPFAVRSVPADRVREVTLRIAGLVGDENPCAIVNDQRVQAGDHVESLTVERIETDAVVFAYGEQRLRLPVAEASTRVRLPL